jgi:hypothetical protein
MRCHFAFDIQHATEQGSCYLQKGEELASCNRYEADLCLRIKDDGIFREKYR